MSILPEDPSMKRERQRQERMLMDAKRLEARKKNPTAYTAGVLGRSGFSLYKALKRKSR